MKNTMENNISKMNKINNNNNTIWTNINIYKIKKIKIRKKKNLINYKKKRKNNFNLSKFTTIYCFDYYL